MKDFIFQNRDKIIFVLPFIFSIYQYFQTQKKEVEIEKLKSQIEIGKHQVLLNDTKFRKGYEDFINLLMSMVMKDKKVDYIEKGIIDFMKVAILFAGASTIKTFGAYRKNAGKTDGKNEVLLYMEKLLMSMRYDLGVNNEGLEKYDLLQTFIVGDIEQALIANEKAND